MKKLIIIITFLISGLIFSQMLNAQERTTDRVWASPNASVGQQIGLTTITVTYGRPSVRERTIFGGLVPYDQEWRTGANEATAIVLSDDVLIEGEHVEAGTYSLFTIPGEDEWTIIINNKLSWGTQYDEAEDLLRVQVTPEESHFVEQMIIYFEDVTDNDGNLVIHWTDVKVPVNIRVTNK